MVIAKHELVSKKLDNFYNARKLYQNDFLGK